MPSNDAMSASAPPGPLFGHKLSGDAVLDAAARCIDGRGFDNISLDEVAVEAGVSRTTLYRRFGNREQLFTALIRARSSPFREWARQVLSGEGTLAHRLETVFCRTVLEVQRVGWLDSSIRSGFSPLTERLLVKSFAQAPEDGIGLAVTAALADRRDTGSITPTEVLEWMGRQMLELAAAADWDEECLRERVRFFVIPVVMGAGPGNDLGARLQKIEDGLDRLLAASPRQG